MPQWSIVVQALRPGVVDSSLQGKVSHRTKGTCDYKKIYSRRMLLDLFKEGNE